MYSSVQLDSYYITKLISTLNILRLMVDAPLRLLLFYSRFPP